MRIELLFHSFHSQPGSFSFSKCIYRRKKVYPETQVNNWSITNDAIPFALQNFQVFFSFCQHTFFFAQNYMKSVKFIFGSENYYRAELSRKLFIHLVNKKVFFGANVSERIVPHFHDNTAPLVVDCQKYIACDKKNQQNKWLQQLKVGAKKFIFYGTQTVSYCLFCEIVYQMWQMKLHFAGIKLCCTNSVVIDRPTDTYQK